MWCVHPCAASRAYLKARDSIGGENGQVAIIGVHAGPAFGSLIAPLRLRRVVQHPQDRQRSIELVFEEILRDAEIERKAAVNPAAQVPACVVISEDSLAPTGDRRPQIDAAKRFARQHLWMIGSEFQAYVESFFVIR